MLNTRLFEVKIDFNGHATFSMAQKGTAPKVDICSMEDHSKCNVGEYAKVELENFFESEIEVKDKKIGRTRISWKGDKSTYVGSLKMLVSTPSYYNRGYLEQKLDEMFQTAENVFHYGNTSYLANMHIMQRGPNYVLKDFKHTD